MELSMLARRTAALFLIVGTASFGAAATTRIYLQSDPGDTAGNGQTATFTAPAYSFAILANSQSEFNIAFGPSGESAYVGLSVPKTTTMGAGPYEQALEYPYASTTPGISARSGTGYCLGPVTGRFVVHSVAYDSNGQISSLAADFEQHCHGSTAVLWGELRYNSAFPLSTERPAGWTTPDSFTFRGRTGLAPNGNIVESASTTIYGINAPAPISVANGEYSINGGTFTSTPGTVNDKDTIRVRRGSPTAPGGSASVTVTAGGVSGTFTLVAFTPGQAQTGVVVEGADVSFFAQSAEWQINTFVSPNSISIGGTNDPNSFTFAASPPINGTLSPGAYESALFIGNSVAPSIFLSSASSSCGYSSSGRFAIIELDQALEKVALDFEITCTSGPPIYGEVRINSTIPFNFQVTTPDATPDPMALVAPAIVRAGTTVVSNASRIYGVNEPVPISITGDGEYSLNGGPFTSQPGNANELDSVRVRLTASTVPGALREAVLDVGGVVVHVPVTTYGSGALVNGFAFQSSPGNFIGGGKSQMWIAPTSHVSVPSYSPRDVQANIDTSDGNSYLLILEAPNGADLAPGVYENTVQPGLDDSRPNMAFYGAGYGCDNFGRFTVYELARNPDGSVQSLAADFEQHCNNPTDPPLHGQVRFNSRFPLPPLLTVNRPDDLDGDGNGDIVWQNTDGRTAVWTMSGLDTTASAEILGPGTGWSATHQADFDADGQTDIVWQHPDGRMAIWLMNGTVPAATQQLLNAGSGWHVSQAADLDGDGKADLVFANTDGSVAVWVMNGTAMSSGATILGPGTGWSVAFTGDFDGDGKADLLWTHADGRAAVWMMNGTSVVSTTQILNAGSGWTPVQVADLNGDGRSDIVWRNADGRVAAWLMDGASIFDGGDILGPGTGWSVVAAADFDADGKADLFFQHADGRAAIWLMDGKQPSTMTQILEPGTGWTVRRLVDLDGDGRSDIVWGNADGRYAAWLMRGATLLSGTGILGPGSGWDALP